MASASARRPEPVTPGSKMILSVTGDFRTRRSPSPSAACQAIPRPAHDHERAPAEPERTLRAAPGLAWTPPLAYPNRLNVRSGSDVGPPPGPGDHAARVATQCLSGLAQINAHQMIPGGYWRGPDRRPAHRPVITTGATRFPERDAEASATPPDETGRRFAPRAAGTHAFFVDQMIRKGKRKRKKGVGK